MPTKKQIPKVFMNHVVITGEQKPVKPLLKPVLITSDRFKMPKGVRFK